MIVIAGEALVDLIERPLEIDPQTGEQPPVYDAYLGGGPFNASLALGSLGRNVGYLFPLSKDAYGRRLAARLEHSGVKVLLETPSEKSTPLALVGLDENGKASYRFYRQGTSDRDFTAEGLINGLPEKPDAVMTGTLAIAEGNDPAVLRALLDEARSRGAVTVVDPNMRPEAYQDRSGYAARVMTVVDGADVVKASDDDLAVLFPAAEPEAALRKLISDYHVKIAVMTRGTEGAIALTPHTRIEVPAYIAPTFGDTVGAGDCFLGGLLDVLVPSGSNGTRDMAQTSAETLEAALRQAVVVAGLNCAVSGCRPPTREAVETVLGGSK